MQLKNLVSFLETVAPLYFQEEYDNSGLLVGNGDMEVSGALVALDCTESVIEEAIKKGCNLVISHHPIIFSGLKKLTGKTYVERAVIKAIKNDVALYAIHTNLDNVINGVNSRICEVIGLSGCTILAPKENVLKKLITYVPLEHSENVLEALFLAGAGKIGKYSECSFSTNGIGSFKAGADTNAYVGEKGVRHREPEKRLEVVFPANIERQVLQALHLAHPYEEVAYDVYSLSNKYYNAGSGMIGLLPQPIDELEFLNLLKGKLNTNLIRHTDLLGKKIHRVAVCGGAGKFLLPNAIAAGADIFVSSDFKYHDFFDADRKILVADVGHYESEQFTQQLLADLIREKFPNFALRLTEENTNPINYLI